MTIMTDAPPDAIRHLHLESKTHMIKLQQIAVLGQLNANGYLVRFKSQNHADSLEEALREVDELKQLNATLVPISAHKASGTHRYVRATRFNLHRDLSVKARTFGTMANYPMDAENVSKSGILLSGVGEIPPFKEGTLLEITIDPGSRHFKAPLSCLAKVVRFQNQDDSDSSQDLKVQKRRVKFALQLIDLEPSTAELWGSFIDQIEIEQTSEVTKLAS